MTVLIPRDILILYLGMNVGLAVQNKYDSLRIFWHFGQLIRVDQDDCLLKQGDKIRRIRIKDILEVDRDRNEGAYY